MTAPDVRPYVDLTLYDRTAQQIFDTALILALTKLPGWVPREGNTEVVLLEAMAAEAEELTFQINRLPGAVTEVLLRLFGLTPAPGRAADATATFVAADVLGHEVPAGTRVRLNFAPGIEPVDFTTNAALAIPAGQNTGTIGITAMEVGRRAHGGTSGQVLQLLDSIVFINSVTLASVPGNGEEPETSVEFLTRGVQRLARLVTTLVLPDHFTAAALEDPAVERATTIDNFDGSLGTGSPGDHPGHVTVAVGGTNGAALTAPTKTALEATLESQAVAMLDVHIVDPTITDVDVTVTVRRLASHTDAQVEANVVAILDEYLNPDTWPWAATVRYNELIAIIDRAAGVDYVVSLTVPAADLPLTGVAPLANAGTITVTVQAP